MGRTKCNTRSSAGGSATRSRSSSKSRKPLLNKTNQSDGNKNFDGTNATQKEVIKRLMLQIDREAVEGVERGNELIAKIERETQQLLSEIPTEIANMKVADFIKLAAEAEEEAERSENASSSSTRTTPAPWRGKTPSIPTLTSMLSGDKSRQPPSSAAGTDEAMMTSLARSIQAADDAAP